MIFLAQVKHQRDNSIEALWVERTFTPQAEVPEVPSIPEVPPTYDEAGVMLTPGTVAVPAVPAYTPPDVITDMQVKCHSYADVQMQMLRDDAAAFATPLTEYEVLIAEVEAAIVPYVPPPPVIPQSITIRQARLALLGAGLLDTVNAGMAGMGQSAQIEWEFASEVQRSNPLIGAMAAALGMTDAQLDDLFTLGSTL